MVVEGSIPQVHLCFKASKQLNGNEDAEELPWEEDRVGIGHRAWGIEKGARRARREFKRGSRNEERGIISCAKN